MKYNINTPAPRWALLEARRRLGFQTQGKDILAWANAIKPLRHCAWLIATYEPEPEPIDPVILKARKIYCVANDLDEEYIENSGGWENNPRPRRIEEIMEILNAEA